MLVIWLLTIRIVWGDEAILQDAKILKIYVSEGFIPSTEGLEDGVQVGILLDKTCLYAEQGGQIYDFGTISIPGKSDFAVDHVVYHGKYALHSGTIQKGVLKVGDVVRVEYDEVCYSPFSQHRRMQLTFYRPDVPQSASTTQPPMSLTTL